MERKITIVLALALFVCTPALPAAADIYQYTDENGVLHFTNVNGGGKNHKRVRSEPECPRETAAAPRARPASPTPSPSMNIPGAYLEIINSACDRHGIDPSLD